MDDLIHLAITEWQEAIDGPTMMRNDVRRQSAIRNIAAPAFVSTALAVAFVGMFVIPGEAIYPGLVLISLGAGTVVYAIVALPAHMLWPSSEHMALICQALSSAPHRKQTETISAQSLRAILQKWAGASERKGVVANLVFTSILLQRADDQMAEEVVAIGELLGRIGVPQHPTEEEAIKALFGRISSVERGRRAILEKLTGLATDWTKYSKDCLKKVALGEAAERVEHDILDELIGKGEDSLPPTLGVPEVSLEETRAKIDAILTLRTLKKPTPQENEAITKTKIILNESGPGPSTATHGT